eukprot:scaffold75982_cov65-Phaeocystis_antarctica.AAC.10
MPQAAAALANERADDRLWNRNLRHGFGRSRHRRSRAPLARPDYFTMKLATLTMLLANLPPPPESVPRCRRGEYN